MSLRHSDEPEHSDQPEHSTQTPVPPLCRTVSRLCPTRTETPFLSLHELARQAVRRSFCICAPVWPALCICLACTVSNAPASQACTRHEPAHACRDLCRPSRVLPSIGDT